MVYFAKFIYNIVVCKLFCVVMADKSAYSNPGAVKTLAENNVHFAFALFKKLATVDANKNCAFSPLEVTVVLSALLESVGGTTADQLRQMLRVGGTGKDLAEHLQAIRDIITCLSERKEGTDMLRSHNLIILPEGDTALDTFVESAANFTDVRVLSEGHSQEMEDSTDDSPCIQNLVTNATVAHDNSDEKLLLLASGVYCRTLWTIGFHASHTNMAPFYSHNGTRKTDIPMMHRRGVFNFGVNRHRPHCRIIEMPLAGRAISLYIVLPHQVDGLESLESRFNFDTLERLTNGMVEAPITVMLPKFSLHTWESLEEPLSSLGASDLFTPGLADLSGVCDHAGLGVSKFYHEVKMEVCEDGTHTPTPSDVGNLTRNPCHTEVDEYFLADHPFLYFVKDLQAGVHLLMGRFQCPPSV